MTIIKRITPTKDFDNKIIKFVDDLNYMMPMNAEELESTIQKFCNDTGVNIIYKINVDAYGVADIGRDNSIRISNTYVSYDFKALRYDEYDRKYRFYASGCDLV